ncbi:MAG: AI-2E family transporter [Actinomycetia bacterium]|nr:AI-2E family transporter [Actinomycetes bacterium]
MPAGGDSSTHDSGLYLPGQSTENPSAPRQSASNTRAQTWADVPWRTIVATVAVVTATYLSLVVVLAVTRIITWVVIAGFFAVVLAPLVGRVEAKVGGRRTLATSLVVATTLAGLVGLTLLFVMPVRTQLVNIITDLPGAVHDAAQGKGPIGNLVHRLHIESYVQDNEAALSRAASRLSESPFAAAQAVFEVVFGFITITLLTFLFLSQAQAIGGATQSLIPARRRASARRVAAGAVSAVSGYVVGNVLISLIAGTAAFVCLVALGVPSPVVLAIWVAFADLIPLVGATLGAAACVIAAYLHSPTAGLLTLIFFVIYQQIENSVLYQWIMSRRVNVNPLGILLSVLLAVELFGLLGALLAVPVSGALQSVVLAVRQEHLREQFVLPDEVDEAPDFPD